MYTRRRGCRGRCYGGGGGRGSGARSWRCNTVAPSGVAAHCRAVLGIGLGGGAAKTPLIPTARGRRGQPHCVSSHLVWGRERRPFGSLDVTPSLTARPASGGGRDPRRQRRSGHGLVAAPSRGCVARLPWFSCRDWVGPAVSRTTLGPNAPPLRRRLPFLPAHRGRGVGPVPLRAAVARGCTALSIGLGGGRCEDPADSNCARPSGASAILPPTVCHRPPLTPLAGTPRPLAGEAAGEMDVEDSKRTAREELVIGRPPGGARYRRLSR